MTVIIIITRDAPTDGADPRIAGHLSYVYTARIFTHDVHAASSVSTRDGSGSTTSPLRPYLLTYLLIK